MPATASHSGAQRLPSRAISKVAAKNAAEACPLGKLDVDGLRTG